MAYVDQVFSWMPEFFKPQKKAFIALLGALMCLTGRATMRNLSRYGAGSEKRFRRRDSEDFDFLEFNICLLLKNQVISRSPQGASEGSPRQVIVIDAIFLRKSGAQIEGLGYFHNGSSRALNKLERGLEMSLISVVNIEECPTYALSMHQSVEKSALKVAEDELYSTTIHALDSSQRSSAKDLRSLRYYGVTLRFDTSIKATTKGE